jgi:hypothetical protein
MKKRSKRYIKNLEVHIENALLNSKYALDRFDILIISISSGGLVFSMGFVKDLLPKDQIIDLLFLKISWILFGLSIIFNLLSQVTSYYANKYEISISRYLIGLERKESQIGNQNNLECKKKIFNSITYFFNWSSLVLLILAILILIHFVVKSL